MANILFPGHTVGLVVLPLMLFHQAQLFACATLARPYARRSAQPIPVAAVPAPCVDRIGVELP
jgi:sodium/bile acid cotransporter 7